MNVRNALLCFGFAITSISVAVACSDDTTAPQTTSSSSTSSSGGSTTSSTSSSTSSSSGGGGSFKTCETAKSDTNKCTDAQTKEYSDCISTKCDATSKSCYGADYKTGTFTGGKCSEYITCAQACDCGDAGVDCNTECAKKIDATCTDCQKGFADCAKECKAPPCSYGGTGKTCAELTTCCGKIADATKKATCTAIAGSGSEPGCDLQYPTYSPDCP